MPARKYRTDLAQLLAEGQQIVHTATDAKYRHKVEYVQILMALTILNWKLFVCGEKKGENHLALLHFARAMIVWRKLLHAHCRLFVDRLLSSMKCFES